MTQRQIEINNKSNSTREGDHISTFFKLLNDYYEENDRLLTEYFNENINFNLHFLMKTEHEKVIPIQYEQQHLSNVKIDRSYDNTKEVGVTTISLSFDSNKTDVLVSQEYNYDTNVMKFHIYFSDQCTKDMAATSYFICQILTNCTVLTDTTLSKLSTNTMKRYGATLNPINFDSFMNEKLSLLLHEWVNGSNAKHIFTGHIQSRCSHVHSDGKFINCIIDEDEMSLKMMYVVSDKYLGLLTFYSNRLYLGFL